MFDNYTTNQTAIPHHDLPYECVSMHGNYLLDGFPTHAYLESERMGFTSSIHSATDISSDFLSAGIKEISNKYNEIPWDPGLNSISEETAYDINYQNGLMQETRASSRKRQQYRLRCERRHYGRIQSAIGQSNGIYRIHLEVAQNDNGANRSVTNNRRLLVNFQPIKPYPIHGVSADGPALHCTAVGYLP